MDVLSEGSDIFKKYRDCRCTFALLITLRNTIKKPVKARINAAISNVFPETERPLAITFREEGNMLTFF